ncbi:MAG TPA: diacylglycerol kinase, partial [Bifidobacterium sp.]|nr:diacylglycerol kinase [Bifidobacterium sp.]
FADKAYVTQISMHVDADTYAPDIRGLVESGAWHVLQEGVWQNTGKGSDDIAGFRFVTYARNREE